MSLKTTLLTAGGIGLFMAVLAFGTPVVIWDGGFGDVEYRIKFVGVDGSPIPNVQLRVENDQGTNYFHYPVTDYVDGRVPTSGDDGVLTFHHISNRPEFGGRYWKLFGVCLGTCKSPAFTCRFLLDDKEIHRSKFNDMNARANGRRVTRTWNHLEWLPARREGESIRDAFSRESDRRDKDRNGNLDMGESAALLAIAWNVESALSIERGSIPATDDLEFRTYEETVVVE